MHEPSIFFYHQPCVRIASFIQADQGFFILLCILLMVRKDHTIVARDIDSPLRQQAGLTTFAFQVPELTKILQEAARICATSFGVGHCKAAAIGARRTIC
jgi:hypothetical protein